MKIDNIYLEYFVNNDNFARLLDFRFQQRGNSL